ncbi:hypothetical protein A5844_001310 [Enterococcus sp. 10A9_DIV0425]|uniref:Uncharacterized protein n=1 Tax=Candidatus Enterococcus wittei TaxID=1987383 RepID=A0A242K2A2_9ENTE|nr:QWxxN domain [Enterococcus sp. 10A9_DIV0425]OTP11176.1 hypothetical protein A5844_001310 [Enterococcus sp. 10A9_DIV0425]
MPQKVKMTKKIRLSQANSREAIGKENNKRNDKNKSGNDQAKLNYIANNTGQTLAPDSLLTLDGFLYLYSICQNARLVDPPEQQPIIKKNAPAFEANTRIDMRRDGNQTRIHSFVSTSTINHERIQSLNTPPTMPHQSTSIASPFISASPFFTNQTFRNQTTSTQEIIDVAKIAHELSISVHQKVHALYQLMNCTTTRRTDQVNTYIVAGESVEQTSLKTICQDAVGQEKTQNNQEMKQESEILPFSTDPMTDRTVQASSHFSAEETAHKLSRTFQASFENKYNATINPTKHVRNQVIETFWNDLTKLFYQFFSQHEHAAPIQEQKETNGSLLSYFADWLLSSFSVNYGEQITTSAQSEKNLNVQVINRHTKNLLPTKSSQKKSKKKKQKNNQQELSPEMIPESVSKAKTVLLPEGESYLSPFWHLAEDFFGRVDRFIEHFNFAVFPYLGVEAAVIPSTDYEEMIVESHIEIPTETVAKIKRIMNAYLEHRPSSESNTVPLPSFWFDLETFQLRHKIKGVNQKVKDYLCKQGVPCDGLSGVKLLDAVKKWEVKDGLETKMDRRKRIATIIRNALELQNIELKYTKATRIVLQWRNNNIFQDYTFEELQQSIPKESKQTILDEPMTTEEITMKPQTSAMTSTTTTKLTTESLPNIDTPQLQFAEFIPKETRLKLEKVVELYTQGSTYDKVLRQTVPPNLPTFWYELEVFENREQLENVNKELKAFLCKKNQWCQDMTGQALFLKIRSWVESKEAQTARTRRKKIAEIIRKASGLQSRKLTNLEAEEIILQWRDNNIFRSYKFKEVHQIPIETTALLNTLQVNTPTEMTEKQASTSLPMIRLKKGEGEDIPQSSKTGALNESQSNMTPESPLEIASISPLVKKTESSTAQNPNIYEKMYADFMEKINSIVTAFLEGKSSPVPISEKLPAHWYDGALEVYEKRNETDHVNDKVKEFLCAQKVPCEGLSPLQLITAIEGWIRKEGKEIEKNRIKEIAELILTSSELASQTVSDFQANAIFLQWRNNNIFKDYTFGEINFSGSVDITNSELMETTSETRLHSYGVLPSEITKTVNKIHGDYFDKQPLTLPIYEPLVPFWYDFELYQKRNETAKANEAVDQFLAKQGEDWSDYLPYQPTAVVAHEWVNDEQTDVEILARKEQLAPIILEGYSIRRNLTATEAVNTVLQWENNNVFKDYTFIELKQSSLDESQFRNETLTENSEMKRVPDTVVDSDLELVHKIVGNVAKNVVPATRYAEPLPIFYYHLVLFQKRNETSAVNKKMQEFFTKEGIAIKESSSSDLEKATLQWLQKESTNSASNTSERKQFLAYFLLKAHGVEDLRLGEFLSSTKVQAIFNQWKANTLLEGYTYQEITYTTIHHLLSKAEDPSVIRLNEQKKESHQIYADFIHDRTATISKDQPIQMIYYHRAPFEQREKTLAVNEVVRKFLLEQKVSLKDQSASELIRGMQGWIHEGTTYGTILEREKQVAQLLQKAYGLEEKEMTVKEARYLLLQWENNNAQMGYSYKEVSAFEAIEISAIEANEEEKERVEAFTRENKALSLTRSTSLVMEEKLPEWTVEQQENIRKKIVTFLEARNLKVDVSKPNELMIKTAQWVSKEVEGKETTDITKVKILANIILGKKEDAVISEEKAHATFIKWLLDITEEKAHIFTSTEPTKEEEIQTTQATQATETTTMQPSVSGKQTPKYEAPNWRDKNMRIQVAQFFRQEGVLKEESTLENILIAMGKWFTEERGEMILSYGKLQSLSKVILKELNLYGGEGKEKISDKDARITIMKWVTENILGSSMEGYMIKQILDSPDPSTFTIGRLRKLFEIEELREGGLLTLHILKYKEDEKPFVKKLWFLLLKDVLPNYFLETSTLADELLISNYDSLMQLTGARLLADLGIHTQFNQTEIQMLGTFIWDKISKNGIKRVEELRYTLLPAMLAVAQLEPDLLREALKKGDYHEVALSTFIDYQQTGYLQLKEHQETLYALFTAYQKEVLNWRRKQALAKEVVQTYYKHVKGELVYKPFVLEQDYLFGQTLTINDYTSPNLEDWYKRLTKAVSEAYVPLDKKLIEFALAAFDPEEKEFMFSPETELYEASAMFENTEFLPGNPFVAPMPTILKTTSKLEQTDLFVAVQGDEKRWYALKKLDGEGGYVFYRVDKNPLDYLKYGLMDHKEIWSQGYKKEGNAIRVEKRLFMFVPTIDQSKKLSQGENMQPLIDAFSQKHSDKLYDKLYQSGDDKAILEQIWDVAKHIIPFYDCVTASIDKDVAVAVPSCTIDIVLLIPVFGQVTSLSSKFAFGMAKAMATGGIRNAIRQGARFAPKFSEIKSVLINIRRYLDPGIESITDGSQFVIKELVGLKNEIWVKKNVKQLLERMAGLVKETPELPKDVIRTYLPGKGLEVSAKRMEDESYLLVTNLKAGDVYGNPFWLRGNQLARFTEPASFTEEQNVLLKRLANEINLDQIFVVEPNLNPNAYGSGKVMSVAEKGKETKYFITMNGYTVPVKVTPIEAHGVRYDVIDGDRFYRVNFNGKEWYFDGALFPFVSKKTADEVMKNIDAFESIKDPSALSAPDERGLMWNSLGRSYIKIHDYYIPLIRLHKNGDRYHLVKKDIHQPMTIWIFDPAIEQFRFETSLEKALREEGRAGQRKTWTSKVTSILKKKKEELPPFSTIPEPPGRGAEWNEFRNTIDIEVDKLPPKEVENDTVRMDPLTKFLPEPRMIVYNNEGFIKGKILDTIIEDLPKDPPLKFRVYKGLDLSKTPDFLQSFVIELAEDYKIARERFQKTLEVLQEVLKKGKIADSPQGQYLIQMCRLQRVVNQEPILLEAVNRLISISKKGIEFLQKTADWGYENILIASSDLVKPPGIREYRSTSRKYIGNMAFIYPADPECRIIILADSYHLDPRLAKGHEINTEKSRTFIHETSHLVSTAVDLVPYDRDIIGRTKTGEVLLEEYKKQRHTMYSSNGFKIFVKSIIIHQNKPGLSLATVWRETIRSDLFRVNLQLSDAEMVSFIIRDFAEGRDFNGVLRKARSLKNSTIGDGSLFAFSAVATNTYTYDNFEKDPELEKEQEQTTDNLDLTGAATNESEQPTTVKREVDSKIMELIEDSSNRSSLNPKDRGLENSDTTSHFSSNQQIETEFSKFTEKKSFLDIVTTSIERSTSINKRMDLNQPISKNILQY